MLQHPDVWSIVVGYVELQCSLPVVDAHRLGSMSLEVHWKGAQGREWTVCR